MQTSYTEWLNQNAYTRYPFTERARLEDDNNVFTLPDNLILDVSCYVPAENGFPFVYLGRLDIWPDYVNFVFFSADTGDPVLEASIDPSTHQPGNAYYMGRPVQADRQISSRGMLVIGDLEHLLEQYAPASYRFNSAFLEACTIRPYPASVRSIVVNSGALGRSPVFGDVELIAGDNIRLTYLENSNAIRIDALRTDGFEEPGCECEEDTSISALRIRTINGIVANNLRIEAGPGVQVTNNNNVIQISNTEHDPCCDCPELDEVTQRVEIFAAMLRNVEAYATRANELAENVLSRLSENRLLGG